MEQRIKDIIQFFKIDIWRITRQDVSPLRYFLYNILKKLLLTIELFLAKRLTASAAALTYSTMLAFVPIVAVVFAIARGFGYNKYIENWFVNDALASQPQAAEVIVGFVNSYLVHTKSGVFLGVGLVFMLWTVIMLISNVEKSFNDIWQVNESRSIYRTITDYLAMFLLMPIVIVITSGASIMLATVAHDSSFYLLAPILRTLLEFLPYVIMSALFTALYIFMPNTKVKPLSAIVPGILAGFAMQGVQVFYINSQIWVSSYNAIYGSFAALPLFMLWVQISWTICLMGAELCYANQNLEDFAFRARTDELSHRYRIMLCMRIMNIICQRFDKGERPYTALDIKKATGIPIRIAHDLLHSLVHVSLLSEIVHDDKANDPVFQPAESTENISVGMVIDRIEAQGKWQLEIDMRQMSGELWGKTYKNRADYLRTQRAILVRDL